MDGLRAGVAILEICRSGGLGESGFGAYRFDTLAPRFARIVRHPRIRVSDPRELDVENVRRLTDSDEIWSAAFRVQDADTIIAGFLPVGMVQELEHGLGLSLRAAFREAIRRLDDELPTVLVPSATELPYAHDFVWAFPAYASFVSGWPEYEAGELVTEFVRWKSSGHLAAAIGEYHELLATTRVSDASELGLTGTCHPSGGWMSWFEHLNMLLVDRLRDMADSPVTAHVAVGDREFRYPELLDWCESHLLTDGDPMTRQADVAAAVESFIAAREPCRVGLPPIVGEIRELVALLPGRVGLDRAMNQLGAPGVEWREDLDAVADDIVGHIWAHEDDRDE